MAGSFSCLLLEFLHLDLSDTSLYVYLLISILFSSLMTFSVFIYPVHPDMRMYHYLHFTQWGVEGQGCLQIRSQRSLAKQGMCLLIPARCCCLCACPLQWTSPSAPGKQNVIREETLNFLGKAESIRVLSEFGVVFYFVNETKYVLFLFLYLFYTKSGRKWEI